MAGDPLSFDTNAIAQTATQTAGTVSDVLTWVVLLVLIGMIIYLVMYILSFKHKVIFRRIVNGRLVVYEDKAREWRDPQGNMWWKLLKTKTSIGKKIKLPPGEAVDVTKKGRFWLEGYLTEDGDFLPIKDNFSYSDYKKNNASTWRPFGTTDRTLLANEFRASQSYKKEDVWTTIGKFAMPIAMVIIVLGFLIFLPDILSGTQKSAEAFEHVADKFDKVADKLDAVVNDKQIISDDIPLNQPLTQPPG